MSFLLFVILVSQFVILCAWESHKDDQRGEREKEERIANLVVDKLEGCGACDSIHKMYHQEHHEA